MFRNCVMSSGSKIVPVTMATEHVPVWTVGGSMLPDSIS